MRVAPANVTMAIARNVMRRDCGPAAHQTRDVVEIRTATEDDWPAMTLADTRAFGYSISAADLERERGRSWSSTASGWPSRMARSSGWPGRGRCR